MPIYLPYLIFPTRKLAYAFEIIALFFGGDYSYLKLLRHYGWCRAIPKLMFCLLILCYYMYGLSIINGQEIKSNWWHQKMRDNCVIYQQNDRNAVVRTDKISLMQVSPITNLIIYTQPKCKLQNRTPRQIKQKKKKSVLYLNI